MTSRTRLIACGAIAAAAAGLAAAGIVHLAGATAAGLPVVGQVIPARQRPPGPPISGTTLTGRHLNIASWRGHTVAINLWASWCVPSRKEAPALAHVPPATPTLVAP